MLEFTSPEALSGIVVQSDETGKEGTYTMSFDGVSTDLPKSLMGKISLMFLLISDDTASGVKKLGKDAFYKVTDETVIEGSQGKVPYSAKLDVGSVGVMITYDSITGEILSMSASSDDDSVTLIFSTQ